MKNVYSIKALRKKLRITQIAAAKALEMSVVQYHYRENNPELFSIGQVEKLAALFGVSFNEVMNLIRLQAEGFTGGEKKC